MSNVKSCRNCIHEPKGRYQYPCINCYEWNNHKPKPMTNADRIRNMSDGELAEFLANMQKFGIKRKADSKEEILRMLQAEVKEGDSDAT